MVFSCDSLKSLTDAFPTIGMIIRSHTKDRIFSFGLVGFAVSVIERPQSSTRVRTTVNPRALGINSIILMLVLLHVTVIAGAVDCAEGIDSVRCNFVQFVAR